MTIHYDQKFPARWHRAILPYSFRCRRTTEAAKRLRMQLGSLDVASGPQDMDFPGWRLHRLGGALAAHWAVRVDENYRLTFKFVGTDVESVDYWDYH